jgi:hypothetical protein
MSKKLSLAVIKPATAQDWVEAGRREAPQQSSRQPKGRTKRLTADVPFDLHRQARVHCLAEDISISEFVEGVLVREMERLNAGKSEPRKVDTPMDGQCQEPSLS